MRNSQEELRQLIQAALAARENAYAPYSGYRVGAALLAENGKIYPGCNVENAAFPAGCCAERTALFSAVADGQQRFSAIAIAGGAAEETFPLSGYAYPCGVCRQALAEFAPDLRVIVALDTVHYQSYWLDDLLPKSFGSVNLNKEEQYHVGAESEN